MSPTASIVLGEFRGQRKKSGNTLGLRQIMDESHHDAAAAL